MLRLLAGARSRRSARCAAAAALVQRRRPPIPRSTPVWNLTDRLRGARERLLRRRVQRGVRVVDQRADPRRRTATATSRACRRTGRSWTRSGPPGLHAPKGLRSAARRAVCGRHRRQWSGFDIASGKEVVAREDRRRAVPQRPRHRARRHRLRVGLDGAARSSRCATGSRRCSWRAATWSSSRTACSWTAARLILGSDRSGAGARRGDAARPATRPRSRAERAPLRVRSRRRSSATLRDDAAGRRHRRHRARRQRRPAGHRRDRPAAAAREQRGRVTRARRSSRPAAPTSATSARGRLAIVPFLFANSVAAYDLTATSEVEGGRQAALQPPVG